MEQQAPQALNFLPFILVIFVFYFILIRPQKQQQKKHRLKPKNPLNKEPWHESKRRFRT